MGGGDEQSVEGEDETSSRLDQVALEELGETKEVRSCRTSMKNHIFTFLTAERFCSD